VATPFLGQLALVSFDFAPRGWAFCNGQLLSIAQNSALFALLGTQYGGDGETTFALPDLQGRVPVHQGSDFSIGQQGGAETVTLTLAEIPAHAHLQGSVNQASATAPGGDAFASKPRGGVARYTGPGAAFQISDGPLSSTGGNQPHSNMQPYLTLSWVIALEGIFPSRS
jgi:microcystin-dependent protein